MKKRYIAGCFAILLYAAGTYYFSSHYYPRAAIRRISVGWHSEKKATEKLEDFYQNYSLSLSGYKSKNSSRVETEYQLEDLGMEYKGDLYGTEPLMDSQNPYLWPLQIFQRFESTPVVNMDEETIREKIRNLDCFTHMISSKDAEVVWKKGNYEIVPEFYGTALQENTDQEIMDAINEQEEYFDLTPYYIDPEILKDDAGLKALKDEMQEITDLDLYYQFGDKKEDLSADTIAGMIKAENGKVSVDQEKARAFIKNLSDQYDTAYSPHPFTTHAGTEIIISQGDYGWWTDISSSTETLVKALNQKRSGELQFTYFKTAASYGDRDYGDTYVEVSLNSQSLWCYVDGKVAVSCNIVSGNVSKGYATPKGIYGITYKETGHQMVGEDYDVWTDYWMPFNGNVGLHDASWRSSFGGNRYLYQGSHGCINMPVWAARAVFNLVEKGTPVIVY